MKLLVVYYSRTGNTKKVAGAISNFLNCEIEEIIDTEKRKGAYGFLNSSRQTIKKELTKIQAIKNNPADYDLTIIGTPVWVKTMSTPIRTYIDQHWNSFNKVAFFCTYNGSKNNIVFDGMEGLCAQKPISLLSLRAGELKNKKFSQKVNQFVNEIKNHV